MAIAPVMKRYQIDLYSRKEGVEAASNPMDIVRPQKELSDFSMRSFNRWLVSGTEGNMSVQKCLGIN
jgi:hypothetical protein